MPQNFKGDATELKMIACASPAFDLTKAALDEFYEDSYTTKDFLLMLYDEGRMPFSQRVPREIFVGFIRELFERFPETGTFEVYLFVLYSIFGEDADITFDIPDFAELDIQIDTVSDTEFTFISRRFVNGAYVFDEVVDYDGNNLVFRGISGVSDVSELELLFSELVPAGIYLTIGLNFYTNYSWIGEDASPAEEFNMVDDDDNQIIFRELGG